MTEEDMIQVSKKELNKLRINFGTAKIIATILFISFMVIGGVFAFEEYNFSQEMIKCNRVQTELYICENPILNNPLIFNETIKNSKMS